MTTDNNVLSKILESVVRLQTDGAGRIDTHEKRLQSIEVSIGKLEIEISGAGRISTHEKRLQNIEVSIGKLETEISGTKERIEAIEKEVRKFPNTLDEKFNKATTDVKTEIEKLFNEKIKQLKETQITLPKLLTYIGIMATIISTVVTIIILYN